MKRIGTLYLPVSITFDRPDWRYKMHWYKDNPYFFYPYVFVSPFVTGMHTTREKDFPEAEYIVADSGGYQIGVHRQGVKVSVLDVLRWQESIADVAFTVDIPVYSYESERSGYRYYTDEYFERCMVKSVENAYKMLEAKQNEKMQLWAVIQGGNYNDLKKWYKAMTKEHDFDGYALPVASTINPKHKEDWISQLQFAKEVGTNFHFLGRCEPLLVLVLAKLAQTTKRLYTYDTATAATGLMLGKYHDPYFLSSLSFSKKKPETRVKFEELPCDCPVCSKHTFQEMVDGYYTLLLHNVYVRKRFNDYINAMVKDDEVFESLLQRYLTLYPHYQNRKKLYEDRIKSLIYDEEPKITKLEDYF